MIKIVEPVEFYFDKDGKPISKAEFLRLFPSSPAVVDKSAACKIPWRQSLVHTSSKKPKSSSAQTG